MSAPFEFADRVGRVEPSATIAISNLAAELEADGVDVVDLSVGAPDFETPANIKRAAKTALDEGHTGYTSSNGIPALKEAIVEKLHGDGLDQYGTENLIVTPGGKQALYEVFQTLIDGNDGQGPSASGTSSRSGDEVALLDPAWVSYEAMAKLAGGSLVRVDTEAHDFALEPALDDLRAAVSADTELLVVNSPGNPHGQVYTDAALEGVRDIAVEYDITVISDEIYKSIVYDGREPTSLGALDGMRDRTITLNGFSKAYAMTGWRLGYFAAPESIVEQAGKLHSHSVTCAVNFVQHAGVEALANTDDAVEEMRAAFEDRRDMLVEAFREYGVDPPVPQGAFYLMLPVAEDDQAWAERAVEDAAVATVPGSAFGTPGYVRLSYAASRDRLQEGVDRLAEADLI
ncbi:pyridoxal phosphate-dependent aminotransferase [Halococcoides cellulosivorans]|uniref:Aminotransferase n=1 Tax=Halococcoides cellulosivorans TaxID=1679096 RepID=A0A2R4X1M1_9EURY|nr:pyridoxal phosphate-dependent aminotransferase [Halococcoides cellulosivorans]AWB27675.1 aspartate aminotransferase [Halococcoides cellulosivorans]